MDVTDITATSVHCSTDIEYRESGENLLTSSTHSIAASGEYRNRCQFLDQTLGTMDRTKEVIALTLLQWTGRQRHHNDIGVVDVTDITPTSEQCTERMSHQHPQAWSQEHGARKFENLSLTAALRKYFSAYKQFVYAAWTIFQPWP